MALGSRSLERLRRDGRLLIAASAVIVALAAPLVPAPVLAGGPDPKVNLGIGACYLFAYDLPVETQIRFTLLRSNGSQKAARTENSGDGGAVEFNCLARFSIGDRLVIREVGGPQLRSIPIPRVTVTLNRSTNKASGRAPAGRDARVLSGPCEPSDPLNSVDCSSLQHQQDLVIPADGTWSKLATGFEFDPAGGDAASLFLFTAKGDRFQVTDRANVIQVKPGSAVVTGIAAPGSSVTVRFKDGGTVRGTGTATAKPVSGFFSATVRKNGNPVQLDLGDGVTANVASDATFTVRSDLELDLSDAANDHIQGTCYPNRPYQVFLDFGDGQSSTLDTAGPNGEVDVTAFTGTSPIQSGLTVKLFCTTGPGDRVLLSAVVP